MGFLFLLGWGGVAAQELLYFYRVFLGAKLLVLFFQLFQLAAGCLNVLLQFLNARGGLFVAFVVVLGVFLCRFFRINQNLQGFARFVILALKKFRGTVNQVAERKDKVALVLNLFCVFKALLFLQEVVECRLHLRMPLVVPFFRLIKQCRA